MRALASPRLGAYAGLAAFGLLAGIVLGRAEPVALAAPFALLLAVGLALHRRPELTVRLELDRDRTLEGDELTARVRLEAGAPIERLELLLRLPHGIANVPGTKNPLALRLREGETRELELRLLCERWGAYGLGEIVLRARDRLGLVVHEVRIDRRIPLRVYPRPEQLQALLRPLETQVYVGNQVSRQKGEGIEFADVRAFVPGDRVRRVNWRASARRGELWVNELHPERNADVILFLDTFTEARTGERSTLDLTVRAAMSLAERYLLHKDRVGLVSFGGTVNWLLPATGIVQLYRIVDSLLESEISLSYAWKDIGLIPRRTLPPKALVLALTPLLDDRSLGALLDLRARGFDLAIVDVSPVPFAPPGKGRLDELAHRLWRLRREAVRARYLSMGVPVAEWRDGEPFAGPLGEVTAFRRVRHVRG